MPLGYGGVQRRSRDTGDSGAMVRRNVSKEKGIL